MDPTFITRIPCLIYGLDSATEASCTLPNGVAGCLRLPCTPIPDAIRGAHFLAPVAVELQPPLTVTKNTKGAFFECTALYVPPNAAG
jgi:hypothetical protein